MHHNHAIDACILAYLYSVENECVCVVRELCLAVLERAVLGERALSRDSCRNILGWQLGH